MPRLPASIPDSTLRILLSPGIGPILYLRLRDALGDDNAIASASVAQLKSIQGIGDIKAPQLRASLDSADPAAERDAMSAVSASLILHDDPDYPLLLRHIADPPLALWVRGHLLPQDSLALAVVGSRSCTAYGREQTSRLCALLAQAGLTIVSGGALGIDSQAHRAALRVNGRSIVVLGSGVGSDYPRENADLFRHIAGSPGQASHSPSSSSGAVISEFPTNTAPRPELFPRRNRIISGLSLGVLVIEAGIKSGSLITARLAAEEHHREVMALPGRVDSPASAGCLRAIRDGWASLVTDHADVLHILDSSRQLLRGAVQSARRPDASLSAPADSPPTPNAPTLFDANLSSSQQTILAALADLAADPAPPDLIAARTQLPLHQIMSDLTLLEIRRRVRRAGPGYQVISRTHSA